MTDFELGWLTGLLEGEGSFLAPPPSEPNQPRFVLVMTDEDVVQKAAQLLEVNYVHIWRPSNSKWKPAYKIQIKSSRAVNVMRAIRPHVGGRRGAKIDVILAQYEQSSKKRRLTEIEAREIKSLKGQVRARDVAADRGLHIKTVEEIWRGKNWGHLS